MYTYSYTPASNLGYLASPGQFFMGAKLFIAKRRCPKKSCYGLCEHAWFLWQPKADFRMGYACKNTHVSAVTYLKLLNLIPN